MDILHPNIVLTIFTFLKYETGTKRNFCLACKQTNHFKHLFIYPDSIELNKIQDVPFFDRFSYLHFGQDYDFSEDIERFPTLLKKVLFTYRLNPGRITFPNTVKKFYLGKRFYSSLTGLIPRSAKVLHLGDEFDCRIGKGDLPEGLEKLYFSGFFDKPLNGAIPFSTREIVFRSCFNQPIKGEFQKSVHTLIFGSGFNQSIEGAIPEGVIELVFGDRFNQPVMGCIPENVQILKFGRDFTQDIDGAIPKSVKELTLPDRFRHRTIGNITCKITFLEPYKNMLSYNV